MLFVFICCLCSYGYLLLFTVYLFVCVFCVALYSHNSNEMATTLKIYKKSNFDWNELILDR